MSTLQTKTARTTPEHTARVTNCCICSWCPACQMGTTGFDQCPECSGETESVSHITDCYTDQIRGLEYMLEDWHLHDARRVIIFGTDIGWDHRSGYKVLDDVDVDEIANAIGVNSEWNQTWRLDDDGKLTVTQSHHDSLGESYDVIPLTYHDLAATDHLKSLAEDLIELRIDQIIDEAATSQRCRCSGGPFEIRGVEEVAEHMSTDQEAVWAMTERVARAEWADQRLRAIRYASLVDELRFD